MPPSDPVEQFHDRNRLYAMKYTLSHCQGWSDASQSGRQLYDLLLRTQVSSDGHSLQNIGRHALSQ